MKKIFFVMALVVCAAFAADAVKMSDLKIYINPGHGGYDSDDRPIQIYPFASGDSAGYWESKSNLYKGLHMYHILDSLGAKPYLSRIKNRTEDDRNLTQISVEANNLNCDLFFSIHSNAGEDCNYPLMLYRENAVGTPRYPEAITLSNLLWDNLHSSKLSIWTRDTRYVSGDLTFYPQWGNSGLGVLRHLYVVGLLSEGGMHEHRPEAHRLMSDDFWWLEAWHFVRTIMEYFNTEDRFVTGNIAGVIYDNNNTRENTLNLRQYSAFGRDANRPLNGAKTELLDAGGNVLRTHLTDDMNNGIYLFRNVAPGKYSIRTSIDGYHSKTYPIEVKANEVSYCDVPLVRIQTEPLNITSYSPDVDESELVSCVNPIEINFNQDIDAASFEKALKITPEVNYTIQYLNSYNTVVIKPEVAFDLSTRYTVSVSTDVTTADKENAMCHLVAPLSFSFTTKARNKLELISSFPVDGGRVHYKGASLEFRFDKTIDKANIFTKLINVYDKDNNRLAANVRTCSANKLSNGYGNAVYVLSKDLVPGEQYRVELSPEIKDLEGVPLTNKEVFTFVASDESHAPAETDAVIEDFETNTVFSYSAEESKGMAEAASFYSVSARALFDKNALQAVYKFSSIRDGVCVFNYDNGMKVVHHGDKIGIHVYGDLNEHEVYLGFTSGADTKYVEVCKTDFVGWRYFEVLTDVLDDNYDYILSKMKIVQAEGLYNQSGALLFDNMIYSPSSAVESVERDGIDVVYDSASECAVVKGIDHTPRLELYNVQGALLQTRNDASMSLKGFTSGVYFLVVNSRNGKLTKKLILD